VFVIVMVFHRQGSLVKASVKDLVLFIITVTLCQLKIRNKTVFCSYVEGVKVSGIGIFHRQEMFKISVIQLHPLFT